MASEKRLTYVEDVISLFEKDIADSRDALKTAWPGDKEEIRAEMNGVRAALSVLKHHASHGGTVDAVEVVHGRWEKYIDDDDDTCCRCTACGWRITYEDCTLEELGYNYCPNCGAKMDGGNENVNLR